MFFCSFTLHINYFGLSPGDPVMIQIRKAADRGYADHGWLNARTTPFPLPEYRDPCSTCGFRSLRVMNEDRIRPRARILALMRTSGYGDRLRTFWRAP